MNADKESTTKDTKKTSRRLNYLNRLNCLNRLNNSVFRTQISQMNADKDEFHHEGNVLLLEPLEQ